MFLAGANVLVEAKVLASWPSLGNGRSGQERAGMGLNSDALCYPTGLVLLVSLREPLNADLVRLNRAMMVFLGLA
jgi:hypothetical protein